MIIYEVFIYMMFKVYYLQCLVFRYKNINLLWIRRVLNIHTILNPTEITNHVVASYVHLWKYVWAVSPLDIKNTNFDDPVDDIDIKTCS